MRAVALFFVLTSFVVACSKPKPVRLTPIAGRITSIGPGGIALAVDLAVDNPNGFAIHARNVTGTLEIGDGVPVGRGTATPAEPIPAEGRGTLPTELQIGWTNLPALAPFALSGANVPYRFAGTAAFGGESLNVDLPFEIRGELTQAELLRAGIAGLNR